MITLLLLLACDAPKPGATRDSAAPGGVDSAPPDSAAEAVCGDGVLDVDEACDDGVDNGALPCGCQLDCSLPPAATRCDDGDLCTVDDACDGAGACLGEPPDCDDGDACTTDSCDPETGACVNAGFDGQAMDLWDMASLEDPSTLDLEVISTTTVWEGITAIDVSEIRYTSYESEACELRPVRVEAWVAWPPDASASSPQPGVVVAHGLGGAASEGAASTPAAELGVVSLAYSGPGQGGSEGTGSTPDHLFDTWPHPRNSWFWEHAVAAIRGLTVLETLPEVDPTRLGMTGYSGGGVATYMVNGVDSRVDVAVPVSACGYLDSAARATPVPGWEYDLLQSMTEPKTPDDEVWTAYVEWLDPKNYLATAHGSTLIINGAQDQFFPIDSTVDTYEALVAGGGDHRLLSIKDWDHGWYALFNSEEPAEDASEALYYQTSRVFGLDGDVSELVPHPQVDALVPWTCFYDGWLPYDCAAVQASLPRSTGYTVESVELHFSGDNALTFASWNLQESGGVWVAEVGTLDGTVYDDSNLVYFVEFELSAGLFGPSFKVTSTPHIPPGFVPNIIPIDGPLPI